MKSQTITHSETLTLNKGKKSSTKLPTDVNYDEIRILIEGEYTEATNPNADFPKNILRDLLLNRNNSAAIYGGLSSKDIHKINYYDALSKVTFSKDAVAGTFEVLLTLNKGAILGDPASRPDGATHPALPINQLDLSVVWADDTETGDDGTIDAAELTVEFDQLIMSKDEVARTYGEKLERYAMPMVTARQTQDRAVSSSLAEGLDIGSANLIKRGFIVTLDNTNAEKGDRVKQYQIFQNLPSSDQKALITRLFRLGQLDDKRFYGLDAVLTGVVVVDFPTEVTRDGLGYLGVAKSEALKLLAQFSATTRIRWIAEEYIINKQALGLTA